ncbi:MAG: hypothetical protein HON68_11010 [Gammaproteobacteria bacterium]|jgi:hypothetical protein|nr:hypothetical protein [Gammaproteobacteria bacterium]MBT3719639.1 hypothetical protein [Gammaproteobacteria bacterium]MBT3844603.1 hypothetical protein [Gammaproteobacteria bacterium]MBT3892000.1 hypothetical protein [Gammaproteobacteria bacterium]MBT4299606.1 hypothetical protein [Gammaproteobacteria bacterium]
MPQNHAERYLKIIENARRNEQNLNINNASWEHAQMLFKNLLEVAAEKKEEVRLVSGHLNPDFYDKLTNEMRAVLDSGVPVELVVLDNSDKFKKGDLLSLVSSHPKGKVITAPAGYDLSSHPHFLLVGDRRYRLETDHASTKAVANFGHPEMGKFLHDIYDNLLIKISDFSAKITAA